MSQGAEIVRRSFERFKDDDIDGTLDLFDPEVVFHETSEIGRCVPPFCPLVEIRSGGRTEARPAAVIGLRSASTQPNAPHADSESTG